MGTNKYGCIISYLQDTQPDIYECLNRHCLTKLLNQKPARTSTDGMTFLIPSKSLWKKIESDLNSDDDDEYQKGIMSLRSLIVRAPHLKTPTEIMVMTAVGKNHPENCIQVSKSGISSDKGKPITLVEPKDFKSSSDKDRKNFCVYNIDELPKLFKLEEGKKPGLIDKKVEGGAIFDESERSRQGFIKKIMTQKENQNSNENCILEALVSLHEMLGEEDKDLQKDVCSLYSYDYYATLLIVTQPHKKSEFNNVLYLSHDLFLKWIEYMTTKEDEPGTESCYNHYGKPSTENIKNKYKKIIESYENETEEIEGILNDSSIDPKNPEPSLENINNEFNNLLKKLGFKTRASVPVMQKTAEAELRVVNAIRRSEYKTNNEFFKKYLNYFKDCVELVYGGEPFYLEVSKNSTDLHKIITYSYVRSEAFCYLPNLHLSDLPISKGEDLQNYINISKVFEDEFN